MEREGKKNKRKKVSSIKIWEGTFKPRHTRELNFSENKV